MYSDLRNCERISKGGLNLTVSQPDTAIQTQNLNQNLSLILTPIHAFKAVKDNYTNSMNQPHESFKFASLFDVQVGTCGVITSWLYPGAYIAGFDPYEKHLPFRVVNTKICER